MRKVLLATAAIIGATVGTMGLASAQVETLQGTVATPGNGGSYAYGDNNYMGGTMAKGPVANPTPGTMVIHLGVRLDVGVAASWSSIDEAGGTTKLNPVQILEYMRIYPGVDAMAANGLRYGAAVELRQNYGAASAGTGGAGVNGTSPWLSSQTVFVRRAFAYVAADNFGIVRLGEMDGLMGTFDEGGATTGVFLSPSGTIVGGNLQSTNVGNAWMAPYFGAQSGAEYGAAKIVYLTPSFYGFDFGLEFAPSQSNGYAIDSGSNPVNAAIGTSGCVSGSLGGVNCPNASAVAGGAAAYTNFAEFGARYQNTFGPVAVLGYGTYVHSGVIQNSTGLTPFKGLDFFQFGANVTFAGVSIFGNVLHGTVNGDYGVNAVGAAKSTGFGTGAKYAFGPFTVGALYSQLDDQGFAGPLVGKTQRHAWVFATAATYTPAPGLTFYLDYDYGQQHQGAYNFATGAAGAAAGSNLHNNVTAQGVMLGTVVKW